MQLCIEEPYIQLPAVGRDVQLLRAALTGDDGRCLQFSGIVQLRLIEPPHAALRASYGYHPLVDRHLQLLVAF